MENKIKSLVEKYENIKNSGKLKSYTEEEVKKDFILPLFEILRWDIHNKKEVSAEETISSERVDYGFYLDDRIKFYLEAKKFNVDIHDEKFANQAIKYSFNKGATWAILTNFETVILFNAQDIEGKLSDKLFFEINCDEFLNRFDQLKLLSKDSFQKNLLDKEAERVGKKIQRISVTNLLYKDLQTCRDVLTKNLGLWNEKIDSDLLDEGVQKLLDRLIFIRVAEDRNIEPQTLIPMVRQARGDSKKRLYQAMTQKFREFDAFYNSNLFSEHPFEQWEEYGGTTEKVIQILYGKEGYYEYDFKAMPADVLGTVYENYLSHRLLKSKKGATVSKDANKRKKQGIYYTSSHIVDYIVKNALGPILDKCKSVDDISKIKVLDPACGSGSFLIKAFNIIFEKYKELGSTLPEDLLKIKILNENIYGVDLDQQAVEITRLNLLINALTKRKKMPILSNVRNGNSLIFGTDDELKQYFGKNLKDEKPFNWQEQFPEVFKQGGFDVIIGNPPYVRQEDIKKYKKILFKIFPNVANGTADLFVYFFERAMQLLKNDGYFAYITSNKFIRASYGKKLRIYLKNNFSILQLIDEFDQKVFAEASVDPCIIIIKNEKPKQGHTIYYNYKTNVSQDSLTDNGWTFGNKNVLELKKKIENRGVKIKDWKNVDVFLGIKSGLTKAFIINDELKKELENDKNIIKPLLRGRDIKKYSTNYQKQYLILAKIGIDIKKYPLIFDYLNKFKNQLLKRTDYQEGIMNWYNLRPCDYYNLFEKPKIIYPDISDENSFYWDDQGYFLNNTAYMISGNIKKSWIGLLNSKLMNWYYRKIASGLGKEGIRYFRQFIKELPIIDNTDVLLPDVERLLNLNKDLQRFTKNSEKWNSIKFEIEQMEKKIDEKIYKIYDLTKEEIDIINNKNKE